MDQVLAGRKRAWTRLVTIGWFGLPVVVVGYVLLRRVSTSSTAYAASQVVFLAPLAFAVAALGFASANSRRRSRARAVWGLFAAATACILIGEAALSIQVGLPGSPRAITSAVFDGANVAAMVFLFIGSGVAAALDRMGWRRSLRLLFDGLALMTFAFGVLYTLVGEPHLGTEGDAGHALRLTAYSLLGLALLGAGALVFGNAYALRAPWNRVLAAAIGVLALAVTVWAYAGFPGIDAGDSAAGIVSDVVYLVGYYLLFMAGLYRLARRGRVWASAPIRVPAIWPGVATSTLVFGSVVWLAARAVGAPQNGEAQVVYTVALSLAAVCMVARTALATAESVGLDSSTLSDPVTGAMGPRVYRRAWDSVLAEAARMGAIAAVYSIDMDDFALLNATRGFAAGDRALAAAARALERAAGPGAWVLRLTGDEFCVMATAGNREKAHVLGRALCSSVRAARQGLGVTVSVGLATYPEDGSDPDDLIRKASSARIWAKRQGKNRYSAYDSRIGEAVSVDERLATTHREWRDVVCALVAAADARDPASHDHARNVAALSHLLATDLGLEPEHVERVEIAAMLHDVGKIALPNVMLGGKTLTVKQRTVAREHVLLGERLLESVVGTGMPAWVRAHHERWDGEGYPDALVAEAIPLEARIIALADAYDGMTAGRRYGAPMSKAAALQEIDLGMGTRFDPILAERFIALVGTTGALGWSDEWPES